MKYIKPSLFEENFTCPYCNTLTKQEKVNAYIVWGKEKLRKEFAVIKRSNDDESLAITTCMACKKHHIWLNFKMIKPNDTGVPRAIKGMPNKVAMLYNEARDVVLISSKSACALLRLSLQYLFIELGLDGKNINNDIHKLVMEGLDERVKKALDVIRVTGNNAVHPGVMDFNDNEEVAITLFKLLNFIVDEMINKPKRVDEAFNKLPKRVKDAIEKRDMKKVKTNNKSQ